MKILNKIVSFIRDKTIDIRKKFVGDQEKANEAKRAECQEFMNVIDEVFAACEYRELHKCSYTMSELMVSVLLAKSAGCFTISGIHAWIEDNSYNP